MHAKKYLYTYLIKGSPFTAISQTYNKGLNHRIVILSISYNITM